MIEISKDKLLDWFQDELDKKYNDKLENLKRLFIVFFNLSSQIILLYDSMKEKIEKHSEKQDFKDINILLNKSLFVLGKITQNYPRCIDYAFCDKFIKTFDTNLNLLCTYYHSLNHIEIINEQTKYQKDKIVQGINKLYNIHNKIKDLFRNNLGVSRVLTIINQYKKILAFKIETINVKIKECQQKQIFLQNFQPQLVQLYNQLTSSIQEHEPKQQYKKNIMKMHFQLMHQLYNSQMALEHLCHFPLIICEQTKQKKKNNNFVLQQNCNLFSRWLGVLLKSNYSMKNLKKIKVEQFCKSIQIIMQQYPHQNPLLLEEIENNYQDIQNLAALIINIVKQLQKIDHSGVIGMINDYKQNLSSSNSKKCAHKIIDYQNAMAKFYSLQEQIKKLQKYAQTIVLQQIGIKITIAIQNQQI